VAPHHFTLTDEALGSPIAYDTNTKMNPPLRETADRDAMIAGIVDGTVDAIATDHAPHHYDEKQVEFDRRPFGIVGLETAVALDLRPSSAHRAGPSPEDRRAAVLQPGADSRIPGGALSEGLARRHHDSCSGPESTRQCALVPIALEKHAVRRLGASRRRRGDDRWRAHGIHERGGRAEDRMSRPEQIREKALAELQQHEVLMLNGHFDFGNGYHGRVYLNPHQLFRIRRPSGVSRRTCSTSCRPRSGAGEVVAGPVTGGALLAHTMAGLLDSRQPCRARARCSRPSSWTRSAARP
jgi:hypothetical protein